MDRAGDVSQSPVSVALTGAYDIDRGAPWDGMAAIRINRATPAEYRAIGLELPTGAVIETPPGEIALSYRPGC